MLNVMKEKLELSPDLRKKINWASKYHATNFYIHPTFNHSIEDLPDEIIFNINKDEKLFRLIPIIKDIDNPENCI